MTSSNTMRSLATLFVALCASCATAPHRVKITPTVRAESVTPKIELVSESSHQTQLVAKKLQSQVEVLSDSASSLKDQMVRLSAANEKMAREAQVTATERDSAYQLARGAASKVDDLIKENETIRNSMSEMQISLAAEDEAIKAAKQTSVEKDLQVTSLTKEVSELRNNEIVSAKEIKERDQKIKSMTPAYELGVKVRWFAASIIFLVLAYAILRALVAAGKLSLPFPL